MSTVKNEEPVIDVTPVDVTDVSNEGDVVVCEIPQEEVKEIPTEEVTPEKDVTIEDLKNLIDVESLYTMNYVEMTQTLKDLKNQRAAMVSMFEAITNMKAIYPSIKDVKDAFRNAVEEDPNLAKDEEDLNDYLENPEKYEKEYQENLKKMDTVIGIVDDAINEKYGSVKKTMSFWDDQTIEYLAKVKVESTKSMDRPNLTGREIRAYTDTIHSVNAKLKAMDDRFELKFWKERSKLVGHIKNMEKSMRKDYIKNLSEILVTMHRANNAITKDNFVVIFGFLQKILPEDLESSKKRVYTQLFLNSVCKVLKDSSQALYASRLMNMIFSIVDNSYDYTEEYSAEEMKKKLSDIILTYGSHVSSTTLKMYDRYMREMRKQTKK